MRPAAGTPKAIGAVIDPISTLPSSPPSSVPEKSYLGARRHRRPPGPSLVAAENDTRVPSTSPSRSLTPRVVRDRTAVPLPPTSPLDDRPGLIDGTRRVRRPAGAA